MNSDKERRYFDRLSNHGADWWNGDAFETLDSRGIFNEC
jgi:hypothetical protein